MAKKDEKKKVQLIVPKLELARIVVPIIGIEGPLVLHAWSAKAVALMLGRQMGVEFSVREPKDPEYQYEQSLYRYGDGLYGFPSTGLKSCLVEAAVDISTVSKALLRRSMFVRADGEEHRKFCFTIPAKLDKNGKILEAEKPYGYVMRTPLVELRGSPSMRMDFVRLSGPGRTADIRFRGEFNEWEMDVEIEYVKPLLTPQKIVSLMERAGKTIGLGEGRPEKKTDMGWGRFTINREKKAHG